MSEHTNKQSAREVTKSHTTDPDVFKPMTPLQLARALQLPAATVKAHFPNGAPAVKGKLTIVAYAAWLMRNRHISEKK